MTALVTTFPRGETVVGMTEHKGRLVVATTARVYVQDDDGRLRAVEVVHPAEPALPETQVWGGEG